MRQNKQRRLDSGDYTEQVPSYTCRAGN